MLKLKENKGITLIALIITIIVMLILVGVTINVALNGGLFQKAEQATKGTEEKAILEEMLAMMEIDTNGKFKYETIILNMRSKHPEYKIEYSYPNATIIGKLGTYNYIVSETEIKIGGNGASTFDWESVGLRVDTITEYENTSMNAIIRFSTEGKVIMISSYTGKIMAEIDATNSDNIVDEKINCEMTINETPINVKLTMNEEDEDDQNIYIEAEGSGTIPFVKVSYDYSNEEVLKMLGITNSTGTYTGTWTVLERDTDGNPTKLVSTSNVTRHTLGFEDPKAIGESNLEKGIWSYKNAVSTLNTVAKEATGIQSARSIKIEDIYDIIGEENIHKGTVYNYYYNSETQTVYSKYKTEDGSWSAPNNTGYSTQTFIDGDGNTVVVDSAGDEVTLTNTAYGYELTENQKRELGALASGNYWLASARVGCGINSATFHMEYVSSGYISYTGLFTANGNENICNNYGVRAIVLVPSI